MVAPYRCLLSFALLLGIASPVLADTPFQPTSCKLRGAKHVFAGKVQLTRDELNTFKQLHRFATHPPGANARTVPKKATLADLIAAINRTPSGTQRTTLPGKDHIQPWCGIVDNWHYAALAVHQKCNSQETGNGNAYFKADSNYSAFNDSLNHHVLYQPDADSSLADGDIVLEGSCHVCSSTRSAGTATALPRGQIKLPTPVAVDETVSPPR
ncbi:MAG: hypothetical protein V4673_19240 [Pseudomonadota bacterium]